jgi:hypothetical protein
MRYYLLGPERRRRKVAALSLKGLIAWTQSSAWLAAIGDEPLKRFGVATDSSV